MTDLNAFPEFPLCMFCQDKGITFVSVMVSGTKTLIRDDEYRWCKCPAADKRRQVDPYAVIQGNESLRKLREKGLAG